MIDVADGYVVEYLRETEPDKIPGNLLPSSLLWLATRPRVRRHLLQSLGMHAHQEELQSLGMDAL